MFRLGAVYTSSSSGIGEETRDWDRVFFLFWGVKTELTFLLEGITQDGLDRTFLGLRGSYGPLLELEVLTDFSSNWRVLTDLSSD